MNHAQPLEIVHATLPTLLACLLFACAPTADASESESVDARAGSAASADVETLSRRGTHPSGIAYRYPRDWELQPHGGGVLVPNDAPRDEQGANELYVVLGFPCDERPRDDAASELAVALFGEESRFTPDGAPEESGDGLRFRYRSDGPQGEIVADAYVEVDDGVARCLVAIGLRSAIEARATVARSVFESFEYEAPERDPRVIGSWSHGQSYTNSMAGFGMAVEWRMTLEADGTFVKSSTSAGGDASVSASSDGDTESGTWYADDENLTLVSLDGTSRSLTYKIVDDALVTYDANGSRTIWE
jgi:hypothetical protein